MSVPTYAALISGSGLWVRSPRALSFSAGGPQHSTFPTQEITFTVLGLLADIRTPVMASYLGSLAYCYKLPMNGKGATVAKDCYFNQFNLWLITVELT